METPARLAFEFEEPGAGIRAVDYAELARGARTVADLISRHGGAGSRVLLLHPPGPDYVAAFFGCLFAGAIAVPAYSPTNSRGLERVEAIASDSGAELALTDSATLDAIGRPGLGGALRWAATDGLDPAAAARWQERLPAPDDLAFLQYTSGSTGTPKGVMVSHGNLAHNAATIAGALDLDPTSRSVSWLPPYHDMGLIGGILQPVHSGFPATLLSPLTFLRRPLCWLRALSRTRATVTVAPDFAYAETVRRTTVEERRDLDLSALRHALVGSEPIRAATLDEFAESFREAGFRRDAFYPCYGLAEATLFVSGGAPARGRGPTRLPVLRSDAAGDRPVVAAPGQHPTAVLTGCGRAHGDDVVVVVDPDSGVPSRPDTVGEIRVSGPAVALGYWRHAEATRTTFESTVEGHPERTFLRTGDLGFWHDDELFVAGRMKDLIVVRGRNHHPHDIEQTAEAAHPLLQPFRGAAFAVDDGNAERAVLVHEVTARYRAADWPAVVGAVRQAVAGGHGLHLDDVVLVRLGSIPRTSSGKIRRTECRERWRASMLTVVPTEAGNRDTKVGDECDEVPEALAALVAASLDAEPATLTPDTPLVSLGLDSLRAVRLSVAMEEIRGTPVAVDRLLDGMTLRQLGTLWTDHPTPSVPAAPAPSPEIATRAQERMWLLDQLGAGPAYHVAGGLRLTGQLDPDRLRTCLADVLDRRPTLRSVFAVDETDGSLRIRLRPPGPLPVPMVDLTGSPDADEHAREALEKLAAEPFDLRSGPLLRLLLLKLAPTRWCLGFAAHHIVLDGWSLGTLLRQLAEAYGGRTDARTEPPVAPPTLSGEEQAAAAAFWRAELAGARPVDLPTDRPHPGAATWRGAALPVELPAHLAESVRVWASEHETTPFTVLLAAFGVLLANWTGQDDLVVGTVTSGRDRPGTASAIGLLADTLPVRVDLRADGDPPGFATVVDRVRVRCLAGYRHSKLPFDEIVRASGHRPDGGRAALVRALFVLQSLPVEPWEADGLRAEPFELPAPGAQFPLSVHLTPHPDGSLRGHAVYATDLFDAETIASVLSGLPVLLAAALARSDVPMPDLPVLAGPHAARIARSWSDGGPPALQHGLLHELVAAAARDHSDTAAVVWDGGELSYRELLSRGGRLADRLRSLGVEPDQPVAILLDRSPELLVAVYGVLAAGGAYLPLDTAHPPARLGRQARDAGARILVTSRTTAGSTPDELTAGLTAVIVDGDDRAVEQMAHPPAVRPENLANVLYTSGSTGVPKGVMTTHAALANRLMWMQWTYRLRPGEAVLHKTPVGFDVAGWELLWPLTVGATVVLARPGGHRDPGYLADLIVRHQVTTCHFVPSMLQVFLEEPAATRCAGVLRRVVCSGEELVPALAERCRRTLPGVQLHNLYGPTEAAIDVTAQPVTEEHLGRTRIPIGTPISGVRTYVLTASGRLAPPLVPGELHVGGVAPARGYLGRPGLTAERFVPDPFHPGGRLYRTGDRACLRPDGTLEYLGRLDRQLKIRGQRIEPGEVEVALGRHPAVAAAAVQARPGPDGEPHLYAWVVPAGSPPAPHALRAFVRDQLPDAMVPDAVCLVAELPVSTHGKLDRDALPDPAPGDRSDPATRIAPRGPVERAISAIWSEVVGCAEPSVTDDFYELGGHSLLANRVAVRVRAAFGVDVPVSELLGGPLTIEQLARLVAARQLEDTGHAELGEVLEWVSGLSEDEVAALLGDDPAD